MGTGAVWGQSAGLSYRYGDAEAPACIAERGVRDGVATRSFGHSLNVDYSGQE